LREIGQIPLLTPAEENDLALRTQRGDPEAREQMIKANLRLVVRIAQDYADLGLPLLDLISEGNIGLMKAVDHYDPSRGCRFCTFAVWWIRASIWRSVSNQVRVVRVPEHVWEAAAKLRRAESRLLERLGREPTNEELAAELRLEPARVSQIRTATLRPVSLHAPVDDGSSADLLEMLRDENAVAPDQQYAEFALAETLRSLLDRLTPRERTVIGLRFGMDGDAEKSFSEVGDALGIARQRAHQIEQAALRKLRRMLRALESEHAARCDGEHGSGERLGLGDD